MPDTSNLAGMPTWPAAYMAGLLAGYYTRVGEENERWRASSTWRPNLKEPSMIVSIGGERVRRWTWREREADRIATLREGHAAGLHETRSAAPAGCPECAR